MLEEIKELIKVIRDQEEYLYSSCEYFLSELENNFELVTKDDMWEEYHSKLIAEVKKKINNKNYLGVTNLLKEELSGSTRGIVYNSFPSQKYHRIDVSYLHYDIDTKTRNSMKARCSYANFFKIEKTEDEFVEWLYNELNSEKEFDKSFRFKNSMTELRSLILKAKSNLMYMSCYSDQLHKKMYDYLTSLFNLEKDIKSMLKDLVKNTSYASLLKIARNMYDYTEQIRAVIVALDYTPSIHYSGFLNILNDNNKMYLEAIAFRNVYEYFTNNKKELDNFFKYKVTTKDDIIKTALNKFIENDVELYNSKLNLEHYKPGLRFNIFHTLIFDLMYSGSDKKNWGIDVQNYVKYKAEGINKDIMKIALLIQ